ncbi:catechol O-methyltransferase-like isoform X2 [Branchiostoma floridae x Branchiostoma japonicum]
MVLYKASLQRLVHKLVLQPRNFRRFPSVRKQTWASDMSEARSGLGKALMEASRAGGADGVLAAMDKFAKELERATNEGDSKEMSKEQRTLQYVLQNASRGDPDSVLATMDTYAREQEWAMHVGDSKGGIMDSFVKEAAPQTMLELGTYMGYSAVRTARLLPPGAKFITLEYFKEVAAVAKEIISFAGLQDRVIQVISESSEAISQMKTKYNIETFDMVFIDHFGDFYLRDIKLLEENNLLRKGTVVVADNIIHPGAPEYADYVRTCGKYDSTFHKGELYGGKPDGLEKSVYRG